MKKIIYTKPFSIFCHCIQYRSSKIIVIQRNTYSSVVHCSGENFESFSQHEHRLLRLPFSILPKVVTKHRTKPFSELYSVSSKLIFIVFYCSGFLLFSHHRLPFSDITSTRELYCFSVYQPFRKTCSATAKLESKSSAIVKFSNITTIRELYCYSVYQPFRKNVFSDHYDLSYIERYSVLLHRFGFIKICIQ